MRIFFRLLIISAVCFMVLSCADRSAERAGSLLQEGRALAEQGSFNASRLLLDSLHSAYPKCVEQRMQAKALEDSIVYVESLRDADYADSLLASLMPKADSLLRFFRYEKNERYEDVGKYVHRLLQTGSNAQRCFLQAYTTDARETIVKSYYYGAAKLTVREAELTSDEEQCRKSGSDHTFEAEGWHSVMTTEGDDALEMLNFVSSHISDRLRVKLSDGVEGSKSKAAVFYLNDNEKQALQATYQLGIVMRDIRQLEDIQRIARARIEKYEQKYML